MIEPGVIAPLLTPFENDGSIALDAYLAHARSLLADGCVGLAPFGTTGEGPSIGGAERRKALEHLVAGGIPPAQMLVGTGTASLADTVELTNHAGEVGCAGVLVLPPYYFKSASQDGLYRYFADLADLTSTSIYLYHIPPIAGIGIPVDLVARLAGSVPSIVGVKDSSGDWSNTSRLFQIPDLEVYPGSELPLLEALALALGGNGCISATANINARDIATVIDLWISGRMEEAGDLHNQVASMRRFVEGYPMIPSQKEYIAGATGDPRWRAVLAPLETLDSEIAAGFIATLASDHGRHWPEP